MCVMSQCLHCLSGFKWPWPNNYLRNKNTLQSKSLNVDHYMHFKWRCQRVWDTDPHLNKLLGKKSSTFLLPWSPVGSQLSQLTYIKHAGFILRLLCFQLNKPAWTLSLYPSLSSDSWVTKNNGFNTSIFNPIGAGIYVLPLEKPKINLFSRIIPSFLSLPLTSLELKNKTFYSALASMKLRN